MKAILYINILSAVLFVAHNVAADDTKADDDAESRARLAYQRGTELFADEQYAAAAEAFREANRQKPSWKIQYNIAQSESAAKRYGLALQAFELFLAEGGDEIGMARKDEVLAEIRRLREMVASVDVAGPPGAEVFVDGVKRGVIPLEGLIKVTAGKRHEIKVMMDGEEILARIIRLSGGDETTIEAFRKEAEETPPAEEAPSLAVDQTPASVAAESTTSDTADEPVIEEAAIPGQSPEPAQSSGGDDGKKLRVAGAVLIGVGGAVAVLGGVLGGLSLAKTQDVKDLCQNENNVCTSGDGQDAYDQAMGLGKAANVVIPAGVVLAGTGLVLYLIGRRKKEKLTALKVVPIVEHSGGAILMAGTF